MEKGFSKTLVILVIIAIGAVGYVLFIHQFCEAVADDLIVCTNGYIGKVLQEREQSSASPSESLKIPSLTNQNDTKDRKTYRNEEYGFEFKYPKDFHIFSMNDYQKDPAYKNDPRGLVFSVVFEEETYAGVERIRPYIALLVRRQGALTAEQYLANKIKDEQDIDGNSVPLEENTLIAQNPLVHKLKFAGDGYYALFKNNLVYELAWGHDPDYESLVDQMFTTFEFIK